MCTVYSNTQWQYKRNETINFHKLEKITEEAVSTFQIVVKEYQNNGVLRQKHPLDSDKLFINDI